MALDIVLLPLALEQKAFKVGDTIRVSVSFSYTVGLSSKVKLYAGPYYYVTVFPAMIKSKRMVDSCIGESDIQLEPASTPTPKTASVDFTLVPKANGGIDDGIYGLRVWIDGTKADVSQDDVLVVSGNPSPVSDISQMMSMMMMVMMMGMVMPMITQSMGDENV